MNTTRKPIRRIIDALIEGRMREAEHRVATQLLTYDDKTLTAMGTDRASLLRKGDHYHRF